MRGHELPEVGYGREGTTKGATRSGVLAGGCSKWWCVGVVFAAKM